MPVSPRDIPRITALTGTHGAQCGGSSHEALGRGSYLPARASVQLGVWNDARMSSGSSFFFPHAPIVPRPTPRASGSRDLRVEMRQQRWVWLFLQGALSRENADWSVDEDGALLLWRVEQGAQMASLAEELDLTEALMKIASLPYLDEHVTVIEAEADAVWHSLGKTLDSFSRPAAARYARLVGAADCTASGPRPLTEGSTFPGFRVVAAVPGRELILEGRHRFSTYALIFRLEHVSPGRSRLRAESRAAFPGLAGGIYRRLVIGTGGHVVGMRRLLSAIRRRSE
jgi:hypothetical protein